jgi:hypothetical protein
VHRRHCHQAQWVRGPLRLLGAHMCRRHFIQSITIPTPTRTVSPSDKSKAPVASCDPEGAADRFAFCTHAHLSASACFGVTVHATHALKAFPCLFGAHLLQLMDICAADENLAKCGGYTTTEAPWPTRLVSTCRDLGLNPVSPATAFVSFRIC